MVLSNRIRRLLKASSLGILGAVVAGCSSGFQRFDDSFYQEAVPQQAQNPYPGDVDPTTTASAGRRLAPAAVVGPRPVPQGVYHQPEPTLAARQPVYNAPAQQQPAYTPPTRQPLNSFRSTAASVSANQGSSWKSTSISSAKLPKAGSASSSSKVLDYAPPKPDQNTVYIPPAATDKTTTASINNVPEREVGWTSTGGTKITVREGETLYNLSKRYGVPVNDLRSANGLSASSGLKAGQQITIPNYIYSPKSKISAPDIDPKTRAASAGTGYIGEARNSNIAVPTSKPEYHAAVSPSGVTSDSQQQRYVPKSHVSPSTPEKTPDYGIVTGSVDGNSGYYTIQSGDSLSKIAAKTGTTVTALKAANQLSGNTIVAGQKLRLPTGVDSNTTASLKPTPEDVDPIVTGSLDNTKNSSPNIDTDAVAPARSGISEFRWPVKGRVVTNFGEKDAAGANEGIDISVPEGTAVRAAENGVVIYAGNEISAYGNLILVRHADDWVSAYAHNRDFEVKKGDSVRRGQIIARSGKTGEADRPKLHFELRKNSKPVDPKQYLAGA